MLTLPNVTVKDDFDPTTTLEAKFAAAAGPGRSGRLVYLVANNSVLAQFKGPLAGSLGQAPDWSPAPSGILLPPQSSVVEQCTGFRVKNAVPGSAARVVAQLSEPGDIVPAAGTPFTQTLQATGSVSAAALSSYAKSSAAVDITTPAGNVETDILNVPIHAGDIKADSQFEFIIRGDLLDAVADSAFTLRAYIGATKVLDSGAHSITNATFAASRVAWVLRGSLSLRGALNSQWTELVGDDVQVPGTAPVTGEGNAFVALITGGSLGGASAVDMSVDQTFRITGFWAVNDANHSFRKFSSLMLLY